MPRIACRDLNWLVLLLWGVGKLDVADRPFGFNLRLKNTQANNGLAGTACGAAGVGGVIGSLCCKGGQPYYGEDGVDSDESVRLGDVARSWVPRSHY